MAEGALLLRNGVWTRAVRGQERVGQSLFESQAPMGETPTQAMGGDSDVRAQSRSSPLGAVEKRDRGLVRVPGPTRALGLAVLSPVRVAGAHRYLSVGTFCTFCPRQLRSTISPCDD